MSTFVARLLTRVASDVRFDFDSWKVESWTENRLKRGVEKGSYWAYLHLGPSGQKPTIQFWHITFRTCLDLHIGPCLQKPLAYHWHSFTFEFGSMCRYWTQFSKNEIKEEYLAISVLAASKFREKVTLWHFGHVIFVKKLAVVALFAQTSEPMLTDDMLVECHMAKLAIRASRTHVDFEQIADHCSRF